MLVYIFYICTYTDALQAYNTALITPKFTTCTLTFHVTTYMYLQLMFSFRSI